MGKGGRRDGVDLPVGGRMPGDGLGDCDEAVGWFYQGWIFRMAASVWLLAQAVKTLPMGTAYAVWTGIGALGAVVLGIVIFKEPATAARMFFAALLLVGIIGLKATAH